MIDAMTGDDRIEGCLDTLILGVLRLPFKFNPADLTPESAEAMAFIQGLWSQAIPDPDLYELLKWSIMGGVGFGELVWDTDADPWRITGLKVWHLQHFYWREDIRRYIVTTDAGQIEVDPGNGKWIMLQSGGMRGWMRGAVRQLWRWWVLRALVFRDWAHHSEILGQGILLAKTPADASEANKDRFVTSLRTMGSDGIVELPQMGGPDDDGFDLGLLEAEFDHGAGFEKLLLRCEANFAVRLLGQNATSEAQGQYIARGVFGKVTLDRIDGLVGPLEAMLRDQVCRAVCLFNFGNADLAPTPKYDAEPPPDKTALASAMLSLGQFLLNATNAGYDVDPAQLTARFGVTLTKNPNGPPSLQAQKMQIAAAPAAAPPHPAP